MSADIIYDTNHPHGSIEGFQRGCHGSHCPAPMSCRDVYTRYQGDYTFRKAIDAGATPEQILEQERAPAPAATAPGRRTRGRQYCRRAPGTANTPNQKAIFDLHSQGLTDREIAERLGKTRDQVCSYRSFMKLPVNRKAPAQPGASSVQETT